MTKKEKAPENSKKQLYLLTDETIALVRELLQLTLYTGTNIIDHLRNVRLEESEPGHLVPNEDYVVAYNKMVEDFAKKANEMAEQARLAEAKVASASAEATEEKEATKH